MQSHRRAKELIRYDPKTGSLTRKTSRGRWRAGETVGTIRHKVDATVFFEGRDMSMGRFIYWLQTGKMPAAHIDHKNGDPTDFRWKNLRPATPSQNNANQRARPNKWGYPGVAQHHKTKHFKATLSADGWTYYLGTYKTARAAGRAYKEAKAALHGEWNRQARRSKARLPRYVTRRPSQSNKDRKTRQAHSKSSASR